jgi:hypothetical protein
MVKSTTTPASLTLPEYEAVLRRDFLAFIQRCFYKLNPASLIPLELAPRGAGGQAWRRVAGSDPASDREHPATAPEVTLRLDRAARLVA